MALQKIQTIAGCWSEPRGNHRENFFTRNVAISTKKSHFHNKIKSGLETSDLVIKIHVYSNHCNQSLLNSVLHCIVQGCSLHRSTLVTLSMLVRLMQQCLLCLSILVTLSTLERLVQQCLLCLSILVTLKTLVCFIQQCLLIHSILVTLSTLTYYTQDSSVCCVSVFNSQPQYRIRCILVFWWTLLIVFLVSQCSLVISMPGLVVSQQYVPCISTKSRIERSFKFADFTISCFSFKII